MRTPHLILPLVLLDKPWKYPNYRHIICGSLESRPAFFKRMYKMYTAISQKQTRRKKPNDSISRLSADRIFRATPNWD